MKPAWNQPVFISGCPRSGTTALARHLSTHPKICIFNEYHLYHDGDSDNYLRRYLDRMSDDNFPPLNVSDNLTALRKKAQQQLAPDTPNHITRNWLFEQCAPQPLIYGDKMPIKYLDSIDTLKDQYPGCRYLITYRDGRSVIASQIRAYEQANKLGVKPDRWMKPSIEDAQYLWLRFARNWLPIRDNPPTPCLEVRYEDGIDKTELLAKKISHFLNIEYREDEFTQFYQNYQPAKPDVWREQFPDMESRLSTEFTDALRQLGYPP